MMQNMTGFLNPSSNLKKQTDRYLFQLTFSYNYAFLGFCLFLLTTVVSYDFRGNKLILSLTDENIHLAVVLYN
jgi:hypothetical protein